MDNKEFQPAKNIDDAWNALDIAPLSPNDPRYVDCSQVRGSDVITQLKRRLDKRQKGSEYLHLLFSGYRGNGKTTELFQFMNQIEGKYKTLYFNAQEELDINDLTFPDLLLGIAKMATEKMEKEQIPLPDELLKQVGDWFSERLIEKTTQVQGQLQAQAGASIPKWFSFITAKVLGSIKASVEERKFIRQKLRQETTDLIKHVNNLLKGAQKVTKEKLNKDFLIIIDNLDRLRQGLEVDLFIHSGQLLRGLECNFIYVVPISLFHQSSSTILPFDEILRMPMIPVRNQDDLPNEGAINHLFKLIEKRFVLDAILAESAKTAREFILTSGGHLRDLIRMLRDACYETDDKIDMTIAKKMINRLSEEYDMVVKEHQYQYLIETYRNKDIETNEDTQNLIYNTIILVYHNADDSTWKDVHPALVGGKKFQELLKAKKQTRQKKKL
jgi:DNA polymerase III delta prime subunit